MIANILNNFCMLPVGKSHNPQAAKTLVESMRAISVFELRPQHVLRRHFAFEDILCRSGGYSFYRKYDPQADDFYLELVHRGEHNHQSTINFVETKCHFGGTRWWFECPKCLRRCAKLYDDRDNFYCRGCLDLEYASHSINYRSDEPTLKKLQKLEDIQKNWRPAYSFYGDRMTKRARKEEELLRQVQIGTAIMHARLKRYA